MADGWTLERVVRRMLVKVQASSQQRSKFFPALTQGNKKYRGATPDCNHQSESLNHGTCRIGIVKPIIALWSSILLSSLHPHWVTTTWLLEKVKLGEHDAMPV